MSHNKGCTVRLPASKPKRYMSLRQTDIGNERFKGDGYSYRDTIFLRIIQARLSHVGGNDIALGLRSRNQRLSGTSSLRRTSTAEQEQSVKTLCSCNPYLSVSIDGQTCASTQVMRNMPCPVWDEEYNLDVDPQFSVIDLHVYHVIEVGCEPVHFGYSRLVRSTLENYQQEDEQWHPILYTRGSERSFGTIAMYIRKSDLPDADGTEVNIHLIGLNWSARVEHHQKLINTSVYLRVTLEHVDGTIFECVKTQVLREFLEGESSQVDINERMWLTAPEKTSNLVIRVCVITRRRVGRGAVLASLEYPLSEYRGAGASHYDLLPKGQNHSCFWLGMLCIKCMYANELILPTILYNNLEAHLSIFGEKSLLGGDGCSNCQHSPTRSPLSRDGQVSYKALEAIAIGTGDPSQVARTLVRIAEAKEQTLDFLETVCRDEIDKGESLFCTTLFRGSSLATSCVVMYFKFYGTAYLQVILQETIDTVYTQGEHMEVDPARHGECDNLKQSQNLLLLTIERLIETVFRSANAIPLAFRVFLRRLRFLVGHKADQGSKPKEDASSWYTSVTGFLFLRFLVPALVAPTAHDVCPNQPPTKSTRALTLISKVVQSIASLASSPIKEQYLDFAVPFIRSQRAKMLRFVDEVTDVEDTRAFIPVASQSICLAHQYERLYGMLVKALPTMETMANFGGKRCQGVMPRARSETLPSGVKETSAIRLLISTIERLQRSHQLPPHVLRQVRDQQQPTGDDGVPGIRPRLRSAYSNPGMTMLDDVQSTLDGPNRKWGSDLRLSDLQTDNDRKPEYQRLSTKRSSSLRINTQDQHQPKGREERATDPSSRSVSSTHEGPGDRELPSTPAGHFNKPKTSPLSSGHQAIVL